MDYQIKVLLTPEYMNKKQWFFWCILRKDVIKEEVIKSNCGFGWSPSVTTAFCDAYKYYLTYIASNSKSPEKTIGSSVSGVNIPEEQEW